MAEYGLLEIDREYEFTVKRITENATPPFISRGENAGTKLFCHHFILEDQDRIGYRCQICIPQDSQNYCNIGDTMTFKVKAFSREIHTIDFLARDGVPIKGAGVNLSPFKTGDKSEPLHPGEYRYPQQFIQHPSHSEFKIAALKSAAIYYQNRVDKSDELLQKAQQFLNWLEKD